MYCKGCKEQTSVIVARWQSSAKWQNDRAGQGRGEWQIGREAELKRVAEWQRGRAKESVRVAKRGTVAEWQFSRVAEWQRGSVAVWQCGRVAVWQSGRCSLALSSAFLQSPPLRL